VHSHVQNYKVAEAHRVFAEAQVLTIANSFAPDEPLRQSFLAATPVVRILSNEKKRNRSLARSQTS